MINPAQVPSQTRLQNETNRVTSSRIAHFAKMTPAERMKALIERGLLQSTDINAFCSEKSLDVTQAEKFIENMAK